MAVCDEFLKVNNTFEGMQEKVYVTRIEFYIEHMNLGSTVAWKKYQTQQASFDIFYKRPSYIGSYFRYRTQRVT